MKGRRPQPTVLKLLRGNPGKRRLDTREPQPAESSGRCPAWLKGYGKEAWRRLHAIVTQMRAMTLADELCLALLCSAVDDFRHAREIVEKEGRTYKCVTKSGDLMIRLRPEVGIAAEASSRMLKLMVEFGLTPASRTRLKVIQPKPHDPVEDYLKRGKPL